MTTSTNCQDCNRYNCNRYGDNYKNNKNNKNINNVIIINSTRITMLIEITTVIIYSVNSL